MGCFYAQNCHLEFIHKAPRLGTMLIKKIPFLNLGADFPVGWIQRPQQEDGGLFFRSEKIDVNVSAQPRDNQVQWPTSMYFTDPWQDLPLVIL